MATSIVAGIPLFWRRYIWRLTVKFPYAERQKGRGRRNGSPTFYDYMVRGWFTTRKQALAKLGKYQNIAEAEARARGDYIPPDMQPSSQLARVERNPETVELMERTKREGPEEDLDVRPPR